MWPVWCFRDINQGQIRRLSRNLYTSKTCTKSSLSSLVSPRKTTLRMLLEPIRIKNRFTSVCALGLSACVMKLLLYRACDTTRPFCGLPFVCRTYQLLHAGWTRTCLHLGSLEQQKINVRPPVYSVISQSNHVYPGDSLSYTLHKATRISSHSP